MADSLFFSGQTALPGLALMSIGGRGEGDIASLPASLTLYFRHPTLGVLLANSHLTALGLCTCSFLCAHISEAPLKTLPMRKAHPRPLAEWIAPSPALPPCTFTSKQHGILFFQTQFTSSWDFLKDSTFSVLSAIGVSWQTNVQNVWNV